MRTQGADAPRATDEDVVAPGLQPRRTPIGVTVRGVSQSPIASSSSSHCTRCLRIEAAAALGALCASMLVTAACGGPGGTPVTGQGPPPAAVVLEAVQPADVRETTDYIGTLKALRSTTIQPQVAGHVTRIFVASGDRVGAGALLVQIDPDRQQAAVDTVEAALAARQADVDLARQNLGRLRSLLAERVVSQAEVDQAEAALKTSEAGLDASRAQLREGRVQLRYFQVVAPTAGTVGDVPIRVGDRVTTDTMLTTIDSIDRLELNVQVPSQRAASLRPGLVVQVLGDDGEPLVDTEATFISPRVDEATQSVLVKTVFANPGTLRANQFVRARLVWATTPGLLIPVLAVLRLNGQPFVFVAEDVDGRLVARQRPVTLGPIAGDAYTVVAGLEAGQRVVVSGVQRLGDGVPIAVAPGA